MKKFDRTSSFILFVTFIFCVICYGLLPPEVVVQRSVDGNIISTMPKLMAIIIAFAMTFISTMLYNKKNDTRFMIASFSGILILVVTLMTN